MMAKDARTALITGAGSGIGLATTKVLLSAGFNVIAHVRSGEVKLGKNFKKNLTVVEADLSSKTEIDKLCHVLKQYQIDVLINNAAHYIYRKDFLEIDSNEIEELLGINVIAVVRLCRLVLPKMINNGWFLGIRDENYDNVILVCEMEDGEINGVIPELDFFKKHFKFFSRDTKGQIKFNLGFSNNNIQWIIPNSDLINVNSYINNFDNL